MSKHGQNYNEQFTAEFGIHFKDSPGELEFALEFIRKVYEQGKVDGVDEMLNGEVFKNGIVEKL